MSNILTAYFSASGETAKLAKTFAQTLNSSLYEIKPKIKYSPADLDWMDKTSRSSVEMSDENARPQIEELPEDISQKYIFLLFPIWWYQAPRIIQTFLESGDFAKKQ